MSLDPLSYSSLQWIFDCQEVEERRQTESTDLDKRKIGEKTYDLHPTAETKWEKWKKSVDKSL